MSLVNLPPELIGKIVGYLDSQENIAAVQHTSHALASGVDYYLSGRHVSLAGEARNKYLRLMSCFRSIEREVDAKKLSLPATCAPSVVSQSLGHSSDEQTWSALCDKVGILSNDFDQADLRAKSLKWSNANAGELGPIRDCYSIDALDGTALAVKKGILSFKPFTSSTFKMASVEQADASISIDWGEQQDWRPPGSQAQLSEFPWSPLLLGSAPRVADWPTCFLHLSLTLVTTSEPSPRTSFVTVYREDSLNPQVGWYMTRHEPHPWVFPFSSEELKNTPTREMSQRVLDSQFFKSGDPMYPAFSMFTDTMCSAPQPWVNSPERPPQESGPPFLMRSPEFMEVLLEGGSMYAPGIQAYLSTFDELSWLASLQSFVWEEQNAARDALGQSDPSSDGA